jgi:hypothetical protein
MLLHQDHAKLSSEETVDLGSVPSMKQSLFFAINAIFMICSMNCSYLQQVVERQEWSSGYHHYVSKMD